MEEYCQEKQGGVLWFTGGERRYSARVQEQVGQCRLKKRLREDFSICPSQCSCMCVYIWQMSDPLSPESEKFVNDFINRLRGREEGKERESERDSSIFFVDALSTHS